MKNLYFTLLILTISAVSNSKIFAQVGLNFNGTSNYVTTNGSPVLNNQSRTVDAWIKTTNTITTQKVICDWGAMTPNGSRFTFNMINNKLRIEVGGVGIPGTAIVNTGQWVHVSAVYNSTITSGANVFLYVNGVLDASGNFTGYSTLTTTNTGGFRIGNRNDGINFYEGAMDEVKVYNYARTQAQIAADTLEYCSPQAGLVAYYKLNEGIANGTNTGSITATDYSGFGNHGTLNSFTLSGTSSNWVPGRVMTSSSTLSVNPNSYICIGTTLTLSTNASSNYTWSSGASNTSPILITPTVNGIYTVAVTNSLNCTTTSSIIVNNSAPSVTVATAQNSICLGASTGFTASGAVTYSWSGGVLNGQPFSPTTTSTYTLLAANGCSVVSSVHTLTVTPLQITTLATPSTVCEGYTCTLTAAGAANAFTWSPANQTGSGIVVTPMSNTQYTVAATNGTCIGTATLQVNTLPTPSIITNNSFVTSCEGEAVLLSANGAGTNGTYTWLPGTSSSSSVTVYPTTTTIYTVSGTNTIGCTSSAFIPVLVVAKPNITLSATNTLVCYGQSVTLNASGALTYTWDSGATTVSINVSPLTGLNVYSVSATASGNSCTATETIAISVITPSVTFSSNVAMCIGKSATLTASGANTYSWNNISTGTTGLYVVNPTNTTIYTLIATTQSLSTNCLSTHLATVIVNTNPTITAVASITTTICRGNSNTLTASGAIHYTWSPIGLISAQIVVTPTVITNYTVTGVSAVGCESTNSTLVVKVITCTGISETNLNTLFSFYPNPAKGELVINSEIELNLNILNLNGQLVKSLTVLGGITKVDLSDLSKGVYFIVGKENINFAPQKLVIQ